MPVYLLHGFRWPRSAIRIHIILQNLDDAAAEWLVAPDTTAALLDNFSELFPDILQALPHLRFVEQYDPNDITSAAGSQPFAYVADTAHEVTLGQDIDEVKDQYRHDEQLANLELLRDRLSPDAKISWFVVVCGDEERLAPTLSQPSSTDLHQDLHDVLVLPERSPAQPLSSPDLPARSPDSPCAAHVTPIDAATIASPTDAQLRPALITPTRRIKKWAGVVRRKSMGSMRHISHSLFEQPSPPMPARPG